MARVLRSVPPGDAAAVKPVRAKSVVDAAKSGTYLELQEALRDRLAVAIGSPDCLPRDLAALTRRLQEVVRDIESERLRLQQEAEERGATGDEDWDSSVI